MLSAIFSKKIRLSNIARYVPRRLRQEDHQVQGRQDYQSRQDHIQDTKYTVVHEAIAMYPVCASNYTRLFMDESSLLDNKHMKAGTSVRFESMFKQAVLDWLFLA